MSRSFSKYMNALSKLENNFSLVFAVENNEDLNKIHFCFKKKLTNEEYIKIYHQNLENFEQNADISIIENDYKKILSKVSDINDIKQELKTKI
jgi:hypothetical protein